MLIVLPGLPKRSKEWQMLWRLWTSGLSTQRNPLSCTYSQRFFVYHLFFFNIVLINVFVICFPICKKCLILVSSIVILGSSSTAVWYYIAERLW